MRRDRFGAFAKVKMLGRLVRHPLVLTLLGTALFIAVSVGVTAATVWVTGTHISLVATDLLIVMPALIAPAAMYPLLILIKRQRELRADLERMVRTDVLTDLPNRRAFFEFAQAAFAPTKSQDERQAVAMMIDVDHFKRINDSYGHDVGDVVLKRVAGVIRDEIAAAKPASWTVARIGGEEFALLAEGLAPGAAARLAERICIQVHRWVGAGDALDPVTVSIGVAFRTAGIGIDRLLKEADDAVYIAKANGRDRWVVAGEARIERARRAPRPLPSPANDRVAAG